MRPVVSWVSLGKVPVSDKTDSSISRHLLKAFPLNLWVHVPLQSLKVIDITAIFYQHLLIWETKLSKTWMGTIHRVHGRQVRLGLATKMMIKVQATILLLQSLTRTGEQDCWLHCMKWCGLAVPVDHISAQSKQEQVCFCLGWTQCMPLVSERRQNMG